MQNRQAGIWLIDVLGRFSTKEREEVDKAIEEAADAVEVILGEGIDAAMNKYNAKKKQ